MPINHNTFMNKPILSYAYFLFVYCTVPIALTPAIKKEMENCLIRAKSRISNASESKGTWKIFWLYFLIGCLLARVLFFSGGDEEDGTSSCGRDSCGHWLLAEGGHIGKVVVVVIAYLLARQLCSPHISLRVAANGYLKGRGEQVVRKNAENRPNFKYLFGDEYEIFFGGFFHIKPAQT